MPLVGRKSNARTLKPYVKPQRRKGTLRDWAKKQKAEDSSFTLEKHAREHKELCDAVKLQKRGLPLPPQFEVVDGKVVRIKSENQENIAPGAESVEGIKVGDRCEVMPGERRGEVMYVGEVPELAGGGHWVGIRFDEPVGKMCGRVKATVYFEAMENCGGMIRGKNVTVGDYPEMDLFDEDDSDEDGEEEL